MTARQRAPQSSPSWLTGDAFDQPLRLGNVAATEQVGVIEDVIELVQLETLRAAGVAAVYTPKDFEVSRIIEEMADLVQPR